MKNLKIIYLAFGTFLFNSCATSLYTSLDVLRPAKVAFAPQVTKLLLVNNTVTQPSNIGHSTQLFDQERKNVSISTDSLAIYNLGALSEELEGKNFFSTVKFLPKSVNEKSNFNTISQLNQDSVISLCSRYNVDAILSLDKLKVEDDLSELYAPEKYIYLSSMEVYLESSWSIHYPTTKEISVLSFKDSIYWQADSEYKNKATGKLPKREDALIDAALNSGRKSVNRFIPYWEKVDRYFFNHPNKNIKQGMDSVFVKNWNGASNSFKNAIVTSKDPYVIALAQNNLAICYEIKGEFEKALECIIQSYYNFGKLDFMDYDAFIKTAEYMNELNARKSEIEILKKQIGK